MDSRIANILEKKESKVSLRTMNLRSVPLELKECDWIEHLDISDNLIEKLENLPKNLKTLNCSSNLIQELELMAVDLPNLERLLFQQNSIEYFELHNFKNLTEINGSDNPLSTLFSDQFPPSLQTLRVENCQITQINLNKTFIKYLFLKDNEVKELSSETLPMSLITLNMNNNDLDDSCKLYLKCFPTLVNINLDNNNFTKVPMDIPDNLDNLNIQNNEIEEVNSLPTGLKRIDLEKNKIKSFTAWGEGLNEVYLENNKLTSLTNMNNDLETLIVSDNLISNIDEFPTNLETINLSDNKLKEIPFFNINLEDINLENNFLTSLPKPLPMKLSSLNINGNKFTYDPISYIEQNSLIGYECSDNPFNNDDDDYFYGQSDSDDTYDNIFGSRFKYPKHVPATPYYMSGKPNTTQQYHYQYGGKTYAYDLWNFKYEQKNKVKLFGREEI